MTNAEKDFEFPTELLVQPKALVGITGLDTVNNAVHRDIWDALIALRKDRREHSFVRFKLLSTSHEFPRPKPKKSSYELHIPKGILKRNWMNKHLNLVPAVVAILYDLDWDDPHWEEKKQECISRVQSMRLALEGRSTRVCLVLIQKVPPKPTVEDPVATERASSLFQAAGLSNKSLFILPHTEPLLGYTLKLEGALYELSCIYYQNEIQHIQAHKENLNRKTHQYLYVRHHFKMGFYSELRQDFSTAKKYYKEAYYSLLEVRLSDTNEFEVKTVAGFIGYKISRVEFLLNKWDDAISHFKAHIEHYKLKTGHELLLFQHHAWLCKQFSIFADLFGEMMHLGKPTTQIQHPGFYYKLAAKHAEQRKILAHQLCMNVQNYPNPDPLAGWETLEFFGQRPWRPCKLSAEPQDPELERLGILALQYNEKMANHSGIIIGLLGNALTNFKKYRCPKMRQHLVIQMAEEYYVSKDYGKALTLLMHIYWDYRKEKWYLILNKLIIVALASAYLTASICEYVTLCLDVISRQCDINESNRALKNLVSVTNGGIPESEPELAPDEVMQAIELWKTVKAEELITIDTSIFPLPMQCKAVISKHEYNSLIINVVLKSAIPEPFIFSKLTVVTLGGSGQQVEHTVATHFYFNFDEVKTFTCSFIPTLQDIGKPLQISSVLLNIGEIEGRTIALKFNGFGTDSASFYPELLFFKQVKGPSGDFLKLKPKLTCIVSRRVANVSAEIKHHPPALLNEWYPLRLYIDNKEVSPVTKASVWIYFPQNFDQETINSSSFRESGNDKLIPLPYTLELGELENFTEKCFYIKCGSMAPRALDIRLNYNVDGHLCVVESQIKFEVKEPFKISAKYMSTKFEELKELYTRGPFLIQPKIISTSPWPITIHSTSILLKSDILQFEGEYECLLKGCQLDFENTASELTCASAKTHSNEAVVVASFTIVWARTGETETTSHSCVLPQMKIVDVPISITVSAPATGVIKSEYIAKYYITNHSSRLYVVELHVEASDEFRFAGAKKMHLFLQPQTTKELEYKMIFFCCGTASLPHIKLRPIKEGELPNLAQVVRRALPANIFIMPEAKKSIEDSSNLKSEILDLHPNVSQSELDKT